MTLTDFLLARIAEDEAAAESAEVQVSYHRRWRRDDDGLRELTPPDIGATFSPARVLADCEAKRRIVEEIAVTLNGKYGHAMRRVLELTSLPYADHPDYREEWKP